MERHQRESNNYDKNNFEGKKMAEDRKVYYSL